MKDDELLSGENVNIEYKREVPEKSIKYVKSVVAFANCKGGRIVFGIDDETKEVVGMDNEHIFQTVDAITTAIADSCEPAIMPSVALKTIEGKTVIIVEVEGQRNRPYYVKSLGLGKGVFVRVSGTTRPADSYIIRELMFEGANRSFDQTVCPGLEVTETEIEDLCNKLRANALEHCRTDDERRRIKPVTKNMLVSWGVLEEREGKLLPTNAFALLTGSGALPTKVQCAVFKGNTRTIFVDRREFEGPVYEQLDEAYKYVLAKINLGAKIEGLYREDVYELPEQAIRETLVNAIVHRSYLQPSHIQVIVFDDRVEITSPGGLPSGLTVERMKAGYSIVRNEALANVFLYMRLFEHFGSGIPRVIEMVKSYGLREPEYIDMEAGIRVNFYRLPEEIRQAFRQANRQVNTQANQDITQDSTQVITQPITQVSGQVTDKVSDKATDKVTDQANITGYQEVTKIGDQVTDKVTDQVTVQVIRQVKELIIIIKDSKLGKQEILDLGKLKHKSREVLEKQYLTPAIEQGLVAMLYPDKPRHPKQKYYLTEKGKTILKTLEETDKY